MNGLASHSKHGTALCTHSIATEIRISTTGVSDTKKKKGIQHKPHLHGLRVAFLNVRGFGDARFRGHLLAHYLPASVCCSCPGRNMLSGPGRRAGMGQALEEFCLHVLGVSTPSKHTTPAPHQQPAPVAHSSGENEDTHPDTHRERGVAILFARDLEAAVTDPPTIIRDPAGRYLTV
jgi:hypothetical protein